MKKMLFCFSLVLMGSHGLHAQNLRLNGYAYYVFDDKVNSYYSTTSYYDGKIKGGLQWGGGLEYMVSPAIGVELLYLRQDTKVPLTYYDDGEKSKDFDLAMNFIMIGFNGYRQLNNPKFEGYLGGMLGADIFDISNPTSGSSASATKFAWGFRAGLNLFASEKIGLKIQTSLISAVQAVGGGVYFGTGGSGTGLSSFSSMLQFGIGGGLVFKLGGVNTKRK